MKHVDHIATLDALRPCGWKKKFWAKRDMVHSDNRWSFVQDVIWTLPRPGIREPYSFKKKINMQQQSCMILKTTPRFEMIWEHMFSFGTRPGIDWGPWPRRTHRSRRDLGSHHLLPLTYWKRPESITSSQQNPYRLGSCCLRITRVAKRQLQQFL